MFLFDFYTDDHWEEYWRLVSDERVMQYITGCAFDEAAARKRFKFVLSENQKYPGLGVYYTILKKTGQHIGLSKLTLTMEGEAELGYALFPEFWGRKLASGITSSLVSYAEKFPFLDHLIGIVDPDNAASVRVLEKHGFVYFKEYEGDGLPGWVYKLGLRNT